MSVPGEQPPFYTRPGDPAAPTTQPLPPNGWPSQDGQVQPYGSPPGGNVPMSYAGQNYPPPMNQNAAAIAILGRKSGGLAAVLSILFVGAGQMYCGHVGRGLAFLAAWGLSWLLMFGLIGFLLAPIVFIWALVDAVSLAGRHNSELARRLALGGPAYY